MPSPEQAAKEKSGPTAVARAKPGSLLEQLLGMATTPAERERAFQIAEKYQQQRLLAELSEAVMETSWGNRVSPLLRTQVIKYALDMGMDPTRHLDVLGGKPYPNATFYKELCAADADFIRPDVEWLHNDERASAEENNRRKLLRIAHAVPDFIDGNLGRRKDDKTKNAQPIPILAACLVTLHFRGRGPFVGIKWSPSRAVDDVGMDFPVQTAESRAWRKAAEKAVSPWFKQHPILVKMEALAVQAREVPTTLKVNEPPAPVAVEDPGPIPELPGGPVASEAVAIRMVRHAPSAVCGKEGDHPAKECRYEDKGDE